MIGSVYVRNVGEIILCRHIPTISHRFWLSSRSGLRAEIVNRIYMLKFTPCISFRFMVFNAAFNSISVISWRVVFSLVEETWVPGENYWPVASRWLPLSHNVVSSTPRHERGSNSQRLWRVTDTTALLSARYDFSLIHFAKKKMKKKKSSLLNL
jgi:hypothetical protein